jgi:hypothetical protein
MPAGFSPGHISRVLEIIPLITGVFSPGKPTIFSHNFNSLPDWNKNKVWYSFDH